MSVKTIGDTPVGQMAKAINQAIGGEPPSGLGAGAGERNPSAEVGALTSYGYAVRTKGEPLILTEFICNFFERDDAVRQCELECKETGEPVGLFRIAVTTSPDKRSVTMRVVSQEKVSRVTKIETERIDQ